MVLRAILFKNPGPQGLGFLFVFVFVVVCFIFFGGGVDFCLF